MADNLLNSFLNNKLIILLVVIVIVVVIVLVLVNANKKDDEEDDGDKSNLWMAVGGVAFVIAIFVLGWYLRPRMKEDPVSSAMRTAANLPSSLGY